MDTLPPGTGVSYEIRDPRDNCSKAWVVHHNGLKPYRGVLPAALTVNHASPMSSGAGASVASAPFLTALSGALPFRPSTQPYVPATAGKQGLTVPPRTVPQGSSKPSPILPRPCSSSTSSSATNITSEGHAPLNQEPLQVKSRSGHQDKRPLKYRDFVI